MNIPILRGIPKNTIYCYNDKLCRYYKLKKSGKRSKSCSAMPYKKTKYGYFDYCKLLKKSLITGDQVKDCGISEEGQK